MNFLKKASETAGKAAAAVEKKAAELDEQYKISEKAGAAKDQAAAKAAEVDANLGPCGLRSSTPSGAAAA